MVNLCIPVLNRYDLLYNEIMSAEAGTLVPDNYFIYDNGLNLALDKYPLKIQFKMSVYYPTRNMGVAKAWNWFLNRVNEERIIANDDIEFLPDTIEKLVNAKGDFVFSDKIADLNMFSMFLIRDSCVRKIGLFDESISPFYGYFEDNDYYHRMELGKVELNGVDCSAIHLGSQTIKVFNTDEMNLHHKRFELARHNYINKWGGMPGKELK